jgi:8-oxo-dGTP diphosphatase
MNQLSNPTTEANKQQAIVPQYLNAIPVVVMLVPVRDFNPENNTERIGVLCIRRRNEDGAGQLALPGGYLEYEDWRQAGLRETFEEAGFTPCKPEDVTLINVESVEEGRRLVIFAMTPVINKCDLPPFIPTTETSERVILYQPTELAFSTHTDVLNRFFDKLHSKNSSSERSSFEAIQNSSPIADLTQKKFSDEMRLLADTIS